MIWKTVGGKMSVGQMTLGQMTVQLKQLPKPGHIFNQFIILLIIFFRAAFTSSILT